MGKMIQAERLCKCGRRRQVVAAVFAVMWAAAACPAVAAAVVPEPDTSDDFSNLPASTVVTTIGMEGVIYFRWAGDPLRLRALPDDSPVKVWMESVTDDDQGAVYELRYVGDRAGQYDLRPGLVSADGQTPVDVPRATVLVRELLPPDHEGELERVLAPPLVEPPRYRLILVLIATVWMVPVLWFGLKLLKPDA